MALTTMLARSFRPISPGNSCAGHLPINVTSSSTETALRTKYATAALHRCSRVCDAAQPEPPRGASQLSCIRAYRRPAHPCAGWRAQRLPPWTPSSMSQASMGLRTFALGSFRRLGMSFLARLANSSSYSKMPTRLCCSDFMALGHCWRQWQRHSCCVDSLIRKMSRLVSICLRA